MIKRVTFDLSCTFKLSRSEDVSDVLKGFIREANRGLLVRGAPKGKESEAAQIKDWKTEGNSLSLRIQSGTYVRAHTAVLRIRKALTAILGKERIGVKGVRADYYSVTLELEKQVSKDIEPKLSTLTKVLRATVDKNVVHVLFEPLSFQEMRANVPDRVLGIVEDILTEPRRAEEVPAEGMVEVIRQSPPKKIVFTDDPARVAMELGWIKEFPGRGQWVYTAPYAKLFGVIRDILIARVARRLEFEPFMLPKLIPLEVMKRMPGYLERIPEGMYYVCSPPRDPRVFDSFKGTFRVTKKVPVGELKRVIRDPGYVLAPAQCEPFWQFFSGETVDADTLPIKLFDCSGWTYRWEGGGVEGIVRLHEFQRIELVYLGTPEQVVSIRRSLTDKIVEVVDEVLDLEWRVTVGQAFYLAKEKIEKEVPPAYDLEVYLPYRGPRDRSEWLEVAGFFVHRKKFIDSFRIRERRARELWTGCAGLGLSRFVAAFLAEYGFEPDRWPEIMKKEYGKKPKLPRFLLWPRREYAKEETEEGQG